MEASSMLSAVSGSLPDNSKFEISSSTEMVPIAGASPATAPERDPRTSFTPPEPGPKLSHPSWQSPSSAPTPKSTTPFPEHPSTDGRVTSESLPLSPDWLSESGLSIPHPPKQQSSHRLTKTNKHDPNKNNLEDPITVIDAPRQSDLMVELIKKLKPQVVVTGMAHYESVTSAAFEQLLAVTREVGARLFLDISDQFELSSLPGSNGVFKYLAGTSLPSHAAIICGLLKNQVYSDLEVAFVISEDKNILNALSKTVELLEGNTTLISQYYYGCLLRELLAFQLADRHPPAERESKDVQSTNMIGFASSAAAILESAELSINQGINSSLIHMDVDQSFLPLPGPVKAAIFESFARQNLVESETDVNSSIKEFIRSAYGFPTNGGTEFIYADSSLSLFNKLIHCCLEEGGTMCFPRVAFL